MHIQTLMHLHNLIHLSTPGTYVPIAMRK